MYPEEGTRTHAIWEYIKQNTLENGGQAPSIRDFIRDGVDNITSTSIVDYHLDKLVAAGLVYRHYGDLTRSRNITIVGSLYVLPKNIQENLEPFSKDDLDQVIFPASTEGFLVWIVDWLEDGHNDWDSLGRVLVAADDVPIQLVAIACGMAVVSPKLFDPKEEDAEENTRVPA